MLALENKYLRQKSKEMVLFAVGSTVGGVILTLIAVLGV
jgi:hypothetical protein